MNSDQQTALATLSGITVSMNGNDILKNIQLTIHQQEQWAIVGGSGSGKTTLAHVFSGKVFYRGELEYFFAEGANHHIELVEQQHHFKNLSNTSSFYYQQRFNASDAGDSISVQDALSGYTNAGNWINLLHLDTLLQKPLIQLSNGENKRLQLAKALMANPGLLILDNPFLGLDIAGRTTLHGIIDNIALKGIHIILITSPADLPGCITHVAVLENGALISAQKKEDYLQHPPPIETDVKIPDIALLQQLNEPGETDFTMAIRMEGVTVRYGEKIILDNISWAVKKGECWNLSGPNGAGKSTLLSLVTGDNPQAYANRIFLFDKRRGSGESIWDIKRKIGFVSPELHVYFEQTASCFEVIASGLFDTIGLFRRLSEMQEEKVMLWMRMLELTSFRDKRIFQLSASQQRMALLARALVKNPPLLILDEPTQGLDDHQTAYFKELVNKICRIFNTTLIYVSHYTKDIPECVDHFLRLENGVKK